MASAARRSVVAAPYATVRRGRAHWAQARGTAQRPATMHVVTMASHETEGLGNLRRSAQLAGLVEVGADGTPLDDGDDDSATAAAGKGKGKGKGPRRHTFRVVGLGAPYEDYTDKIRALHTSLRQTPAPAPTAAAAGTRAVPSPSPTAVIHDDDVVVVVDAYDVLLLPAVRAAPAFLAASPAPVVFCSENGQVCRHITMSPFPSRALLLLHRAKVPSHRRV